MKLSLPLLTCLLCHFSSQAWAEDEMSLFDLSLSELLNIKVSTASLEGETLRETPVAVTVITSEMIANSGARSIKRLLTSYVPGFTAVEDQNEVNVAARGIYTSGQQKILFLLNGHRLNSRSFSSAAPDASLSLDKIQQIEVLRGPASAIYGNVALTAVVNIIVKKAADYQGLYTKVSVGDHGQKMQSVLYGSSQENSDLLIWANHSLANGETQSFTAQNSYNITPSSSNEAIVGGDYGHYDLGLNYDHNQWSVLLNARVGTYASPFSDGGISGETFIQDDYPEYKGIGPGSGFEQQNARIRYQSNLAGGWSQDLSLDLNSMVFNALVVTAPNTTSSFLGSWRDASIGITDVLSGPWLGGDLKLGLQLEGYEVYETKGLLGTGTSFNTDLGEIITEGSEAISSVFVQHKKSINAQWLSNLGIRYDYKKRDGSGDVEALSPRFAFIYYQDQLSLKMSVAQSFVDASYFNRRVTLGTFRGGDSLKPERLTTYQISPSYEFEDYVGQYNATLFYNVADDFIQRDLAATVNELNYSNAGKLKSWGLEQEVWWLMDDWQVRANATYQRTISFEDFAVDDGHIANVPQFTANLIVDYDFHSHWHASTTLQYIGKQFSPIFIQNNGIAQTDPLPNEGVSFNDPDNYTSDAFLVHGQLSYKASRDLRIDLQVENALDTDHQQGGTTLHPYAQTGRWYRVAASYLW